MVEGEYTIQLTGKPDSVYSKPPFMPTDGFLMDSLIPAQPGQTSIVSRMLDPRTALQIGTRLSHIVLFMFSFGINGAASIRLLQDHEFPSIGKFSDALRMLTFVSHVALTLMLMTFQFLQWNRILLLNLLDDRQRRLVRVKWFHHEIGDVNEFDRLLPVDDVPL